MRCSGPELALINSALRRIGAGTIFSADEDNDLADQAVPLFFEMRDAMLGLYHWKWPRKIRQLQQVVTDPQETTVGVATGAQAPIAYAYTYQFPAGALTPPEALFLNPATPQIRYRDFMVEGTTIRANAAQLFGIFLLAMDPPLWPPLVRMAFAAWLAGAYAIPITHDANLAQQLDAYAVGSPSEGMRGGLMGRAIAMDAAGSGGVAGIGLTDDLTGVHFGEGGSFYESAGGW